MATSSAESSSSVVSFPPVPEASLVRHFTSIEEALDAHVDESAAPKLFADWKIVPLVAGLVGTGCEYSDRNRGSAVPVAPVLPLGDGLWAWIGYREVWDGAPPAGRTRRFSFRAAGLTIHFGYRNNRHKPQMFRAEWSGSATSDETGYGRDGDGAADPHWHFDAAESLTLADAEERAAEYLSVLRIEEQETQAEDFSPPVGLRDVRDLVSMQELSRIHFPSAAPWWKGPAMDSHVHSPESETEIQVWVEKTLGYVVRELARLKA